MKTPLHLALEFAGRESLAAATLLAYGALRAVMAPREASARGVFRLPTGSRQGSRGWLRRPGRVLPAPLLAGAAPVEGWAPHPALASKVRRRCAFPFSLFSTAPQPRPRRLSC